MVGSCVLALAVGLVDGAALSSLRGDEAVASSGKRLFGRLSWEGGHLSFMPGTGKAPIPLKLLDSVWLDGAGAAPSCIAATHQAVLSGDQRLTGQLLELNAEQAVFRTSWADRVAVPRPAVRALIQPRSQSTVFADDFENGLASWGVVGGAALDERQHLSGKRSLLLDAPGQSCAVSLKQPLSAVRLSVHFRESSREGGARWLLECAFQGGQGPGRLSVLIGGEASYRIIDPPLGAQAVSVACSPGWHCLEVEWDGGLVLASIDDVLLSADRFRGPGGRLHSVRLSCVGQGGPAGKGQVWLDDFTLTKPLPPLRHRSADPGQDEVWLVDGDSLFGAVPGADGRTITLQARFGKQVLPWSNVRGLYLKRQTEDCHTVEGEQVRVWLRSPRGAEPDELEGQVLSLDGRQLTLRHVWLGDLKLDRSAVQRLRWQFAGTRIELDHGEHHLGPVGQMLSARHPLRAEGPSWKRSFRLAAVPERAYLTLLVVHLTGGKDAVRPPRAAVLLNGQKIAELNDYVAAASALPQEIRVLLPGASLRAGENTLELRQLADPKTAQLGSCGIARLAVEVPQ
jgi:hypothetical protein